MARPMSPHTTARHPAGFDPSRANAVPQNRAFALVERPHLELRPGCKGYDEDSVKVAKVTIRLISRATLILVVQTFF